MIFCIGVRLSFAFQLSFTPWLQPGDEAGFLNAQNRFNGLLLRRTLDKPLKRFKTLYGFFPHRAEAAV